MLSNKDYSKESYIALHEREWWGKHPNIDVMKRYRPYLRGTIGDLGCNNAWCTSFIPEIADSYNKIVGIDINAEALNLAENNIKSLGLINFEFKKSSLCDLPVQSDYFDCLTFFHTLEHIYDEDIPLVLGEIHRVLKKGGKLILTVPLEDFHKDNCHVSFFTVDILRDIFIANNFVIDEIFIDDTSGIEGLITGLFHKS